MIRNRITDCWAAFGDDGEIILPVASFQAQYTLNELPVLKITPALGRNLRSGRSVDLSQIERGMKAELFLGLEGTAGNGAALTGSRKIMSGWVQSEGMSDTAAVTGRWLGAEIGIIHKAGKLAGSPAVSYTFAGSHEGTSLSLSTERAWSPSPLRYANNTNSALFPLNRMLAQMFNRANIDAGGLFPSRFLKAMIIALVAGSEIAGGWGDEKGKEGVFSFSEISNMVRDYNPANLTEFVVWLGNSWKISLAMLSRYEAAWRTQNLWQAILDAAKFMFLSIVPYNEGFYIANPFGWLQTPNLTLSSGEYTSLRQSTAMNVMEPVSGVVVTIPPVVIKNTTAKNQKAYKVEWNYYYPPLVTPEGDPIYKSKGEATGAKIKKGMYYHRRSLPEWLYPFASRPFGWADYSQPERKSKIAREKPDVNLADWADQVGTRAARWVYAQLLSEQAAISLIVPYREDIMPGTILKIQTESGNTGTSIVGDTLYGMVHKIKIYCSTVEESPILQMEVQVTHVRSEKDNQEPPDGVVLAETPLYQDSWVGVNLFGDPLSEIPASSSPMKIPAKTYNAASGGSNPVSTTVAGLSQLASAIEGFEI